MVALAKPVGKRSLWQKSWRLLLRGLLAYVVLMVAMMLLENKLIYHPSGPTEWREPPDPRIKDVFVNSATGETIHGWFLPHDGAKSVFFYSHGNAGNLSHRGVDAVVWAHELNASVLMYDYPGFGKSTGSPTEPGCYAAADAMWDWIIIEAKIPADKVILFGKSLGGAMAIDLASKHDHRALVLARSFTSLPEAGPDRYWFVPVRWLARSQFPNLVKMPLCRRPTFIYHGEADTVVTVGHSRRLYEAAADPKELLIDPTGTHGGPYPKELFSRLRAFLDRNAPD
jgi:fermentation-respiration switch protein FrsA (DUF1100 family)